MDLGRLSLYSLYTFTELRFPWISLFSYIIGFMGLTVLLLSPCLLSVCFSEWTRYHLPWLSVSKTTSPQCKFRCSVQRSRQKCKILIYAATQCSVTIVWRTCSQNLFFKENINFFFWEISGCIRLISLALFFFFSSFSFALMRLSIA